MANLGQGKWMGAFVAANVTSPESIRGDAGLVERAHAFGRQLVTQDAAA